jgi:hypothetical protein
MAKKSYNLGNKYHEKYTEKESLQFFKDSLKKLKEEEDIVFIGTLATKMNTYRDIYTYLLKKFDKKNYEFSTIKKNIDRIIESRLYEKAFLNKGNATMAIFGLKNNHNWKDKTEVDSNNTNTIKIKFK